VTPERHARTAVLVSAVASAVLLAACSSSSAGPPSASVGATSNRTVPEAIRKLPLTNQAGQRVDLASWPGKTVVLVPFLSLCSDICPMTTGNLLQVQRALEADKATSKVQIVELSVDPGRDTPARVAAYAKLTGANWQLVTETPAELSSIARYFGFVYQIVPEDKPPDIDWLSGKPLTYDMTHSDGFVIIDPRGIERFVTNAAPNFHGRLNPTLENFLSPLGQQHLKHPATDSYTPADILQALAWSMHTSLPSS
jgi:protein SCO1